MYYEDLSNYTYYLRTPIKSVFNVGWLVKEEAYQIGRVPEEFLSKLALIIMGNRSVNAQVNRIRSCHPCSISNCDVPILEINGQTNSLGAAELWVPSKDGKVIFAAPTMIYHYIDSHGYLPPIEFIDAVICFDLTRPYIAQEIYINLIQQ